MAPTQTKSNPMAKPLKWMLIFVGVILFIVLILGIAVRFFVGAVNFPTGGGEFDPSIVGQRIVVPDGFSIGLYARDISSARVLRFSRTGDLLVAIPGSGTVEVLERDADNDGKADGRRTLIGGLNGPNGLDFFEDWLYIAEADAIGRIAFDHESGTVTGEFERLVTGLPGGGNHWKKTLRFGDDGLMYVTMGSSCNVCLEEDERRAAMVRYQPDGSGEEIIARGLRNSAGFDWSPRDGALYATDNGRDMLGDDFPSCELNKIEAGKHYGWPFANGNKIPDPDFGEGKDELIEASVAPVFEFRPHNAPLGIEFVRGNKFPEEYQGAAIVALHGSWNRSDKDGYKVVSLHWDDQGRITERDFVSGFLIDDEVVGRPAEVAEGPDGAIYISDDYAGVIYRVAYGESQKVEIPVVANVAETRFDARTTLSGLAAEDRDLLLEQGSKLYRQFQCVSCHADSRQALKTLENLGEKYDLQSLSAYLRRPNPPMPTFPFNDQQRRGLAAYLIDKYPGKSQ